ncbi:MAG: 8-amino-7-oxononanoate synthase [Candidatus Hydrogenedens sp.]|nr:8-amino-7-oxononanoate synthase [Candidatus Hydrogenedens sp.]
MSRFDRAFATQLETLKARHSHRVLRPVRPAGPGRLERDGRVLLNFSGNDYLGLAGHPALIARAQAWTAAWGTGSGASRLVTGTLALHTAIEEKIARLKGTETALIFTSGWQANAAILPALFDREVLGVEPLVFTDRLNHASLHHGCAAAGVRQIRFRHNDLNHLESLFEAHANRPGARFIVTESVFSMDGDRAEVAALADLAQRWGAFLYLDEAHATGVLGPHGMGLSGEAPGGVDLIMGTFSKGLGGFGAYIAGSATLCDFLVNRASGFIFATALPPAVLGAMDAALDLLPTLDAERAHLQATAGRVRAALTGLGIATGASSTQIVPAIIGREAAALRASAVLEEAGILGIAIRPPTVPAGTSRLRLALSAAHDDADIDRLIAGLGTAIAAAQAVDA